jgi:hypothetical protein
MVRYNTRAKETKEKLNVVGHNIRAKEGETMLHKTLHRKTKDQATGAPLNNSGKELMETWCSSTFLCPY